jgi:nucleoside-diphosphate kinase
MNNHPKKERSFVILKPDAIQRGLVGEIVSRFERAGLKIACMKLTTLDEDRLWKHYGKDDEWFLKKGTKMVEDKKAAGLAADKEPIEYGKDIIRVLVKFMSAGPVVVMVIEGNQAVAIVKKLVGGTEPATSDVGTIRGDLTVDSYAISAVDDRAVRNLIHCSDAVEEAEREIKLWLDEKDILTYTVAADKILYDVNLDGIME